MTPFYRYVGTSQRIEVVEITTTRSQRANGTVNELAAQRVLSSELVPLTCAYGVTYGSEPTDDEMALISDLQACDSFDLFQA